jgi:NTP pyrophosphatase (non-canonical NTP hydrolase)
MNQADEVALRGVLTSVTAEITANCKAKGWHNNPPDFLGRMALLHSEISEAVEAWRINGLKDMTLPGGLDTCQGCADCQPEGVGSEYADILIRLLDNCYLDGIDLTAEVRRKLAFNRSRPYRHGGKRA